MSLRSRFTRAWRALFLLTCLLVSLIPGVATLILLRATLNKDISQFVPNIFNDQVGYWHEISTFRQVGLKGGYYSPNELIPASSFLHSDAIGPFFTLTYSIIARVTGWDGPTAILINMALLALGILAFIRLARLNAAQVAVTGLLCLTFYPLLLYVPTIFQESFHQTGAFVLAGLFYRLLTSQRRKGWTAAAAFLLLVLLSLARISWAMFFLPLFVLILPRRWKYLPAAGVLALAIGLALFEVVGVTSAPSNNSVTFVLGGFRISLLEGLRAMYHQVRFNVNMARAITSPRDLLFYQQIIYLGVLALAGGWLLWALWRRWKRQQPSPADQVEENLFHLYNLGLLFIATFTLYLVAGEIRVMSAHLLLSLLLMLAFRRWRYAPILATAAIFLLAAPVFVGGYKLWQTEYAIDVASVQVGQAEVQKYVTYQPDAPSPWCNTVLLPINMYDFRVLYFPPGVGIAYVLYDIYDQPKPELKFPLKSRYLFMDEDGLLALEHANHAPLHVRLLTAMPDGRLYYNEDTLCKEPEP